MAVIPQVKERYGSLPNRTRVILRRLFSFALVGLCIAGLVVAANHTKTGDQTPPVASTGIIEQLTPGDGSAVLQQAQVGIDLVSGWTGVLLINGQEIPEDQLTRHPELYSFLYLPAKGKILEALPEGRVCAEALVWPVDSTRANAKSITWCFTVT